MWNSKIIKFIQDELHGGTNIFAETPFYKGNQNIRKANLKFSYTEDENMNLSEPADPISFANKYGFAMTPDGLKNIVLRDYQIELIKKSISKRFLVVNSSRQTGLTTIGAIMAMYFARTNRDKAFLYLCPNMDGAVNFIDQVKRIYENMEFYMKPGVVSWNNKSIEFDTGCKIIASGSSKPIGFGLDVGHLWMDNAAFIYNAENIHDLLITGILKNNTDQITVTSAPNGYNWFYNLYMKATQKINEFHHLEIGWWQVPNRDNEWIAKELKNLGGGEKAFEKEYGLSFGNLDAPSPKKISTKPSENSSMDLMIMYENLLSRIEKLEADAGRK